MNRHGPAEDDGDAWRRARDRWEYSHVLRAVLASAAGFLGYGTPSLATLCERILGVRLAQGDRLTDWTRRPLHVEQRLYAAADVEHLLELHDILVARLEPMGRLSWATDECEERRLRELGVRRSTALPARLTSSMLNRRKPLHSTV